MIWGLLQNHLSAKDTDINAVRQFKQKMNEDLCRELFSVWSWSFIRHRQHPGSRPQTTENCPGQCAPEGIQQSTVIAKQRSIASSRGRRVKTRETLLPWSGIHLRWHVLGSNRNAISGHWIQCLLGRHLCERRRCTALVENKCRKISTCCCTRTTLPWHTTDVCRVRAVVQTKWTSHNENKKPSSSWDSNMFDLPQQEPSCSWLALSKMSSDSSFAVFQTYIYL